MARGFLGGEEKMAEILTVVSPALTQKRNCVQDRKNIHVLKVPFGDRIGQCNQKQVLWPPNLFQESAFCTKKDSGSLRGLLGGMSLQVIAAISLPGEGQTFHPQAEDRAWIL